MRGKDRNRRSFDLLEYLDCAALKLNCRTSVTNGTFIETGMDFSVVKKAFLERFYKRSLPT